MLIPENYKEFDARVFNVTLIPSDEQNNVFISDWRVTDYDKDELVMQV